MLRMSVVALAFAVCVGPAAASELAGAWFADGRCYQRVYDAAHLARNPGQQTTRIWVGGRSGDARLSAGELNLGLDTRAGGGFSGMAVCRDSSITLVCGIEGDGGNVRLMRQGQELRVTIVDRLQLEGARDFSPELGGRDDRVFVLRRASASACRAR